VSARRPGTDRIASALRADFDRTFAEPPAPALRDADAYLLVAVADTGHAVPLADIGGLYVDRRVVRLPSRLPVLLGVAGFRGLVVPVYDLAALLGYAPQKAGRWLLLAGAPDPVAFSFQRAEGYRTPDAACIVEGDDERRGDPVRGALRDGPFVRPIIRLPSIVEEVRRRVDTVRSQQER
jgi:chemotaxis signal transduction protein